MVFSQLQEECEGWGIASRRCSAAVGYCRKMSKLLMILDAPTLVIMLTVAMPVEGFTHTFLLPAQNPLFFPVSPRVPKATSSEMTMTEPVGNGLGPKSKLPVSRM